MDKIDNLIIYQLSMDNETAVFKRYKKIPNPETAVISNVSADLINNAQAGETDKPPIEHHDHISEIQRNFSILVEPGNNMYLVGLDSEIECTFGPNALPIGIFSADFYKDMVTDITKQSEELLTFKINYDPTLARLREAMGTFWVDHDHAHQDDDHHPTSLQEVRNFAIPFFFNLYDKKTQVPIWVLNNHENSDHGGPKPLWHGKIHPNANAYLVFE